MKNLSFKILFVPLLSYIGYSCSSVCDIISLTYELVYENKTSNAIYFSDGKKIIDSIPANTNKTYHKVLHNFSYSINMDSFYKKIIEDTTLFVKIQNRCFQYKSGKIEYSPFIGDEIKDEKCNNHIGIQLPWTQGTGVYSYKRYTYIPDSRASGGRGYIVYTFTLSDTVGSVGCNF